MKQDPDYRRKSEDRERLDNLDNLCHSQKSDSCRTNVADGVKFSKTKYPLLLFRILSLFIKCHIKGPIPSLKMR